MQTSSPCALCAHPLPPARPVGMRPRPRAGGFTLMELMITVAVLGITLAIGVPSMQSFVTGRAVISQADDLASTLRLARSEALRLNSIVTVCPSTTTGSGTPTCASATDNWANGWLTFADADGNGTLVAGERVLRVTTPSGTTDGLTKDSTSVIRFYRNGLPDGSAEFQVKPKAKATSSAYNSMLRRVELNSTGRVAIVAGKKAGS